MTDSGRLSRWTLRYIALGYLTVLLLLPIGVALIKTFDEGIGEVFTQMTKPDAVHAFKMTMLTLAITVPLVVRLEGTNVELGKKILRESGLKIIPADDLADAAKKITDEVKKAA